MLRNYKYNAEKLCKLLLYFVAATAAGSAVSAGGTAVAAPRPAFMPLGDVAPAPLAYLDFCVRRPAECAMPAPSGPAAPAAAFEELAPSAQDHAVDASAAVPPSYDFVTASIDEVRTEPTAWSAPAVEHFAQPVAAASVELAIARSELDVQVYQPTASLERVRLETIPSWSAFAELPSVFVDAEALTAMAQPPEFPPETTLAVSDANPARTLRRSPDLLAELNQINRRINAAISARPDLQTRGLADHWDLPLAEGRSTGDCEDYVLEKRRALIAEGFPAEALSIAVAMTRRGELHAVLLVATDEGELVLDSLSPWVSPWQDVRYRWLERQAPGKSFDWVSIAG